MGRPQTPRQVERVRQVDRRGSTEQRGRTERGQRQQGDQRQHGNQRTRGGPVAPPPRPADPAHHARRPSRSFRAVGVFVLLIGTIGGVYLGFGRGGGDDASALAVEAQPSTSGDADSARDKALALARAKAAAAAVAAAERALKANTVTEREQAASRSQPRTSYPVPSSCKEYEGNRALGCALLLDAGYGLEQMPCLEKLWTRESGWYQKAVNKSSGAYGIPQALPGSKMATYGSDWQTNPVPQIKWGLNYIKNRYQTPCGAWSFFQSHNWY